MVAFKCIDYSLFRAAKELLYIPLSYDAKYRTKGIIDVFAYRFGKGAASLFEATDGECAGKRTPRALISRRPGGPRPRRGVVVRSNVSFRIYASRSF